MHDPAANAVCPRCGYDQRGVIATWRESCPLHATCAECGLAYSCGEVLQPEKFEPRWCVEYCEPQAAPFLHSCGGTFARSFLPSRFWSRLQMSHRIRPRRIAMYVTLLLLPFVIIYIPAQSWAAWHVFGQIQAEQTRQAMWAAATAAVPPESIDPEQHVRATYPFTSPDWFDEKKELEPEEWAEKLREAQQRYERQYQRAVNFVSNPARINGTRQTAMLEAIFMPFASQSSLSIMNTLWGGIGTYPPPKDLWAYVSAGFTGGYDWIGMIRDAARFMAFGLVLALMFPLSLALLPMSCRKAKVRWAHIGRITAYGLFVPVTAGFLAVIIIAIDLSRAWLTGAPGGFLWVLFIVAIGFIPLGTVLWWLFAIDRHLKMPHALAVTAILMLLCFLAALAGIYVRAPAVFLGPAVL